ncbi:MAG: NAD-dependent epimerase/dehydratase family protein [Bradymonadaceae bacterium]
MQRIVIIGAGYTGLELTRQARERGFEVVGTSRSEETRDELAALGATAVHWDVLDDDLCAITPFLGPKTAVVYSVPTLFADHEAGSPGEPPRHVQPVAKILEACVESKTARFVYLSSTAVYGNHDGEWVDEDAELRADTPAGMMRRDIEDYVLASSAQIDVNVARIVGIYGPGRTMQGFIASGRYRLVGGGTKPSNRVHVEDIAQSVLAMIERGPKGARVYNVCDGNPVPVRDLVEFICRRTGIDVPPKESLEEYAARTRNPDALGRWKNAIRCQNARLTDELGVELRYPDVFEGFDELLK